MVYSHRSMGSGSVEYSPDREIIHFGSPMATDKKKKKKKNKHHVENPPTYHYARGGFDGVTYVPYEADVIAPALKGSPVVHPDHYQHPSGVEVIDLIKDEGFLRGNLLKYIFRAPHKGNELEDMQKAQQYLNWELERLTLEQGG